MHPALKLAAGVGLAGLVWLVACTMLGCYVADVLGWSAFILYILATVRI